MTYILSALFDKELKVIDMNLQVIDKTLQVTFNFSCIKGSHNGCPLL